MKFLRLIVLYNVSVFLLGSMNVFAAGSGAFRVETPDAGAFGKGSAFVGEANTPAAIFYNPAGLSQINKAEISVGTTYLAPQVNYEASSGTEVQMQRNSFWIPHLYAAVPISDKLIVGFGATSYFGLGTEWAPDSPLRYEATKSSIIDKNYMLTSSFQATDQWSIAVSVDNDDSHADKSRKVFQSTGLDDANQQLKVKDNAWGFRIATMYKVNNQHQFGLMYRSRINHTYHGKAYLTGLNNAGSTPFAAIFGGSSYETKVTEKFTLPQSVVVGYSYKPNNKWTFNFDLEWMDWSSVKREALNWTDETDPTRLAVLNNGNPVPHDWHSVWSQAIGAEYSATERLRLRGGYYHHASPVPQATWDPNLPDASSHGFTTGFGYDLSKNLTLDMAYSMLIYQQRKINNTVGDGLGSPVDGQYKQIMNIVMATMTYKF